jgi:hypothetical protein
MCATRILILGLTWSDSLNWDLQIIEFDDIDRTGALDHYAAANKTWMRSYSLANVSWSNISVDHQSTVELTITGIDDLLPVSRNGSVTFKVRLFVFTD